MGGRNLRAREASAEVSAAGLWAGWFWFGIAGRAVRQRRTRLRLRLELPGLLILRRAGGWPGLLLRRAGLTARWLTRLRPGLRAGLLPILKALRPKFSLALLGTRGAAVLRWLRTPVVEALLRPLRRAMLLPFGRAL